MFHLTVSLLIVVVVFNDICLGSGWNPSNFSFTPGDNDELVFTDEFENVGPVKATINGKPAYAPNPKNWFHQVGPNIDGGMGNYTDSIYNSYVQDGQLTIVAMREPLTSAMLRSQHLQEFIFGTFAAKIRLPYGQGMWPAWWLKGVDYQYNLTWPTTGEIDILEMVGGKIRANLTDHCAFGTIHWNNESNTMNPVYNKQLQKIWRPPDGSILHNNSLVYWSAWTPTNITIGVNEFIYSRIDTTHFSESINPVLAFSGRYPFYMILNIIIGGSWPGPPDNTTIWPQQMVVDWVRVYQQKKIPSVQEH